MAQNWDDMRFFLATSRTRSFVAAAEQLMVTHSTVSRRISALEAALQTRLFLRTEKGCRLTPAGEKLLPYAEQIESTVINLEAGISGKDKQLSGAIRIGAPDGLGNFFLAAQLGSFQARHPLLDIELMAVPMYYSLSKREVDLLITITKPTRGNVVARKLLDYRLGLFATRDYLSTHPPIGGREDLPNHRLTGYIDHLLYDENLKFLDDVHPGLQPCFRSSTVIAQLHAVAAGAGIGVLPYFLAATQPTLVPVLPEYFVERDFWLQVNPDTRLLPRVRATIDFIAARMEANQGLFQTLPRG